MVGDEFLKFELYENLTLFKKKLDKYIKKSNNIIVYKNETCHERNNKKILFYNFNISYIGLTMCNKLNNNQYKIYLLPLVALHMKIHNL